MAGSEQRELAERTSVAHACGGSEIAQARFTIAEQCGKDPFGSNPSDKLALLAKALPWSTNLGHPGSANPAEGEVFDTYVITDMFAKAATGALSPKDALAEASTRTKEIFKKWREKKMVGGGQDR